MESNKYILEDCLKKAVGISILYSGNDRIMFKIPIRLTNNSQVIGICVQQREGNSRFRSPSVYIMTNTDIPTRVALYAPGNFDEYTLSIILREALSNLQ